MFTIRNQRTSQKSAHSSKVKHLKTITCKSSFVVLVNKRQKTKAVKN